MCLKLNTKTGAVLLCAAALLLAAGCAFAFGADAEPEDVDWLTMEFDPEVVHERLLAAQTPEPIQNPKEAALDAIEYYTGYGGEARAERARLVAELAEIELIIELLEKEEPSLVEKYRRLAETAETKIRKADEDIDFAEEMIAKAEAAIAEYESENGEGSSEEYPEYSEAEYSEEGYIGQEAGQETAPEAEYAEPEYTAPESEPEYSVPEPEPEYAEIEPESGPGG